MAEPSATRDVPERRDATFQVLHAGYGDDNVASTVGYAREGDHHIITDPGMVRDRASILDPLEALGIDADAITDVILSHHHPDHSMNIALFRNARVHDHWAIYHGDRWHWRDADGYTLSPSIRLLRTPGHTLEDISTLVGTRDGVIAVTHAWNDANSATDRHAVDQGLLHDSRARLLGLADMIVPGHGPAFVPGAATPR